MKISIMDRFLSFLAYYTFGIFSIVLLIFFCVTKKSMSKFLIYHIYQSVFVATILACLSGIYSFLLNMILSIPLEMAFLKTSLTNFDIFLNRTPILFAFTLTGFFVFLLVTYLGVFAILGKKSYLPFVSNVIYSNIRM